jgi:hypothetical protein
MAAEKCAVDAGHPWEHSGDENLTMFLNIAIRVERLGYKVATAVREVTGVKYNDRRYHSLIQAYNRRKEVLVGYLDRTMPFGDLPANLPEPTFDVDELLKRKP